MTPPYQIRAYDGPNHRCSSASVEIHFPEIRQSIDWGPVSTLLQNLGCSPTRKTKETELTFPAALGELASILQAWPEMPWSSGLSGEMTWVCLAYREFRVTRNALVLAFRTLQKINGGIPPRLRHALRGQLQSARATVPYDITVLLEAEAVERGIPAYTVSSRMRARQLGQGEYGWHFIEAAQQSDSLTGFWLSKDKAATCEVLKRLGLPHTEQHPTQTMEQAERAAQATGFPCVVKPFNRGGGRGVTADIHNIQSFRRAYRAARQETDGHVLVERHVQGFDHRMAVFRGRLLWVYRRTPAHITGDGAATLEALIAKENDRRTEADPTHLYYKAISIDDNLIAFIRKQGLTLQTVIPAGDQVFLRGHANISMGGTLDDVTAQVHPENLEMAEQVARAFRLGALGLDFITTDISRSWREGTGAIIEINTAPGLSTASDAYKVVRSHFPLPSDGRVPSFLIVDDDTGVLQNTVRSLLETERLVVGYSSTNETTVGDQHSGELPSSLSHRCQSLVLHPDTQALVISATSGELQQQGLPLDRISAAFWKQSTEGALENLTTLLETYCGQVFIEGEHNETNLKTIINEILRNHRNRQSARPDLITIENEGTTLRTGLRPHEIRVVVWETPCLPLEKMRQILQDLLGKEPLWQPGAHLLTQDQMPSLVDGWARSALHAAGHLDDQTVEIIPEPPQNQLRSKQYAYRICHTDAPTEAYRLALTWAVGQLNQVMTADLHSEPFGHMVQKSRPATQTMLERLQEFS